MGKNLKLPIFILPIDSALGTMTANIEQNAMFSFSDKKNKILRNESGFHTASTLPFSKFYLTGFPKLFFLFSSTTYHQRFSGVSSGYNMETLARNGLICTFHQEQEIFAVSRKIGAIHEIKFPRKIVFWTIRENKFPRKRFF